MEGEENMDTENQPELELNQSHTNPQDSESIPLVGQSQPSPLDSRPTPLAGQSPPYPLESGSTSLWDQSHPNPQDSEQPPLVGQSRPSPLDSEPTPLVGQHTPTCLLDQAYSSPRRTSLSPASHEDGTLGPKPSPRQSLPSSLLSLRRVSVSPASRDDADSAAMVSTRRSSMSVSSKNAQPLSSASREDGDSDLADKQETKRSLSTMLFTSVKPNRMLAFNLPEAKKREVHQHLEECALRAKVKLMVTHMKDMALAIEEEEDEEDKEPVPPPEYELMLKQMAVIEPPPIQQSWLDNILKILNPKVVQKHSNTVKVIMEEVRQEYSSHLLSLSIYMKFSSVEKDQQIKFLTPLKPDVGGKTPNYRMFLACRKVIEDELFLTHPLIRKILSSSKLAIPEVLVNFHNYRKRGWLHLDKLMSLIHSDMKKGEYQICKNWYPKLVNLISVKNSLETVPRDLWPRFVKCASTVLSVQITQLMQRTIKHIIETLSNINTFPQLTIDAYHSGREIAMIPSEDEIFSNFHRVLDTIAYMAQDMPAMEAWFAVPCPNKFIPVKRSESFLRYSHEVLEKNLYELFTPVREYIKCLGEAFQGLCSEEQYLDIQTFLKERHTYEDMFVKVSHIKDYSSKVKRMVYKEYFPVVRLSQTDVITYLNKVSNGFMFQILQEITIQQINENKKICGEFELVAERTLHMPVKTKQLVAMGSYIKYCCTTFMDKAKTRILKSIRLAIQLMDFTSLSEEQLYLNASIVNWLKRIKPIFEEYNDLFENTKYELEERLQRSTEKLNKELEDVGPSLSSLSNMDDVANIAIYVQFIQKFLRNLEQFDSTVSWINNEEVLFKFPISTYPELDELKSIVHPFAKLIFTCNKWFRTYKIWMDGAFDELVLESVDEQVTFFFHDLTTTQKTYKTKCKQQATDNYPRRFKGVVDDPDINNWPAPLKLCSQTLNHITEFKRHLRLIEIVCNSALRKRHWQDLSAIAGFNVTPDAGTTLRKFIAYHLEHLLDPFEVVSVSACKELQLFNTLGDMKAEWTDVVFSTIPHFEGKVQILCDVEDILTRVDNHLIKCVYIRGSAFVKPLIDEVKYWCEKLERINLTIETWQKVEKQWLDYKPIFSCDTIRAHLHSEVLLFQDVDKLYQELMKEVSLSVPVVKTAGNPALYASLSHMLSVLEKISSGAKVYLNKLQLYFPRLFFLSDYEILQMLADTSVSVIHRQLSKMFMGVHDLRYHPETGDVVAMKSSDGEVIRFEQPLQTHTFTGYVEHLLSEIEKQMKASLKVQCKKCLNMYKKESFSEWVVGWPGQAVQCALLTIRTGQIHNCLIQAKLGQLQFVSTNIRNQKEILFNLVQGSLSSRERVSIEALIILTVHTLDFLHLILKAKLLTETDFNWIVQLRYYQEEIVIVKMLNTTLPYGYEYIGNTSRLVVTPLTERCFRSLIGAYHMNLHGAPEGLPETGKCETVRDLAKAIGIFCFFFCCTASLHYTAVGNFVKGIAGSGAWACLNDIHKVEPEVLSVVAQQLTAVRSNTSSFLLAEDQTVLNTHCFICVTLLPGLSAQSSIPDNLKTLFRPVAMMSPNVLVVAQVCLYAYGFRTCLDQSLRLVSLLTLCSQQLSQQGRFTCHFGTLKAVLRCSSTLKQSNQLTNEDDILLKAITETFYPMFSYENIHIFNLILGDLFPNREVSCSSDYNRLNDATTQVCKDVNLQSSDTFVTKGIQTYEAMQLYKGVILIGEPMSGKTSALKVVKAVTSKIDGKCEINVVFINPRTLSLSQLYGCTNTDTNEWVDGIVPKVLRDGVSNQWLVFDGPIECMWVDTLNTALDMTHRLCLTSGEIIQISSGISVIFEALHLHEASPATVSRCGVVYFPPHTVGWQNLVLSWLSSKADFHSGYSSNYNTLFNWIIPPTLHYVETKCSIVMAAGTYNMVRTLLLLIEMMLKDACADNDDYQKHLPVWIQSSTFLAGAWAFGGALTPDSREQFDIFFRDIWKGNIENHPMPETLEKLEINIPSESQLNDYWYHFKGKGAWRFWPEVVRSLKIEEDVPNLQFAMVSTVESAKYSNIIEMHLKHFSAVLLTGPTATGKTFYINRLLNKLSLNKYLPITIPFSPNTSAGFFQSFVIRRLQRKSGKMFRASGGRSAVLFVDDMNMCASSATTNAPLEVIHQYLDHGQWFQEKKNCMVGVEDLLVVCACSLPGGNRKQICPRTLRHFSLFAVSPLTDDTITKIYSTLLFTGFKRNGFATDVMPTVMCIVAATADLLVWLSQNLRATPSKPHYTFSLRDFAKLIYSHLLVKRENIDSKRVFIRLWVHECLRVFNDRLMDKEDRAQLIHRLRFTVKEFFKESFDSSLDNLMPPDQKEIGEENLRNLIFTTALSSESTEDRKYEEVGSLDTLLKSLTAIIENHNSTQTPKITIVLYRFALEHLCRLCRMLSISGGSCLLLGMRGSGRQTIAQLAAFLCKAHFSQPSVIHNYGFQEWRTDLKRILVQAGGNNIKSMFFVSETEIRDDQFVQDLDMVLSTGQVPNIFSSSELEDIFEMVRLPAQGGNRNLDIDPLTVFGFFVSRCRQNLHLVLSLSSISFSFRRWISLYPSIMKYCTIDWVEPYKTMNFNGKEYKLKDWPEEAFEKIAVQLWEDIEMEEEVISSSVQLCKYIHVTAREAAEKYYSVTGRKCYVTSASYLNMVKKYKSLILQKQNEIVVTKAKFICGLEKLELASSQVDVMRRELEALQPQLAVATAETERMKEVIERETVIIDEASGFVREDETVAKVQAAAANNLKIECEADLALAIPILEEAVAALNTLKPTDITLVKSMKNPPDTVKLVMAAVCVMKDIKPEKIPDPNTPGRKILDYWGPSKRLLGDMAFLQQLKDYDKDNIPPPIMVTIRKQYLPNKDFKPHIVAKASSAAEGLCKWVIAMDMYDAVAKEVAPKKAKLEIAEKEFAATMAILEEKRAQVRMLEEKLMELNAKLEAAQQRKKVLEDDVNHCQNKLFKAQRLIEGLGREKRRWQETVDDLQVCSHKLAGDILISCAVIAYLPPLNIPFRNKLMTDWCKVCTDLNIPCSENFNFVKVLGFDINIQNWNINGLPRDEFSTQNAVILEHTDRCPVLIDPQGHAAHWIKTKEKLNGLQVIHLTDDDYVKTIETCMHTGSPVLLENVEEDLSEIILSPFFVKRTEDYGSTTASSRIYITTKLQNPFFLPPVFNNFSVFDFTLTINGLKDKLLDIVIAKERPDLQAQKQAMTITNSENIAKLQHVETTILETLSYTKGNILENETAVEVLETAKIISFEIKDAQRKGKILEEELHSYCKHYFGVVEYSARLYFCLIKLVNVNYMYQFSLKWFLNSYTSSIDSANKSQEIEARLRFLTERITFSLHRSVCCSLFEQHRLLFSLLMCTTIELAKGTTNEEDWNFMLDGKGNPDNAIEDNPAPDWLTDSAWKQICYLDNLTSFAGFASSFTSEISKWRALQHCQAVQLPEPWNHQISSFQKLIIMKILFPHQLTERTKEYIEEKMGHQYASLSSFSISSSFEESNCLTPLLFILTPGSDPVAALNQFARRKQFLNRLFNFSLGVNQGESASALVQQCREEGNWLCLHNCHLAHQYMRTLETLCDSVTLHNTSMEFRLFLTCAPTTKFPISILQNSVKMVTGLASGLKHRLTHSFLSEPVFDEDFFYGCPGKDKVFAKLIYSLSFLHATALERRKYGSIGWNLPYNFTEEDFYISLYQLKMYINEYSDIPYALIQYVLGECNYGGQVHDTWDRRVLQTLISLMVNQQVVDTPNYSLSSVSDKFQVPLRFEYQDFIVAIQDMPEKDLGEVFGLNRNTELLYQTAQTKELSEALQLLQAHVYSTERPNNASTLTSICSILKKLEDANCKVEEDRVASESVRLVLRHESKLYTSLLTTIQQSLQGLRDALLGHSEMSDDVQILALEVDRGQVPSSWKKVSFPTCKALAPYVDDLVNRLDYFKKCSEGGYGDEVWLAGLFCPQALLLAVLHQYSRLSHTPFHLLSFNQVVCPQPGPWQPGLLVTGLFLQGASLNETTLTLQEQNLGDFASPIAQIWFKPTLKTNIDKECRYLCPVYNTVARTDYVTEVLLPITELSSHWVFRGVALLCQVEF